MRICLFEDARAGWLEPLALTRPVFDFRCGLTTLGGKLWRLLPGARGGLIVRPHLAGTCREAHPGLPVNDPLWLCEESVLLVNGRWIPAPGETTPSVGGVDFAPLFGTVGPEIAWAVLRSSHLRKLNFDNLGGSLAALAKTSTCRPAGGTLVSRLWELVERNGPEILHDFAATHSPTHQTPKPANATLVGPAHWLDVSESARIDPFVVVDTTGGPVVIARDAIVHSFSRLEGPCYVGPRSQILGAKIRAGTTIGADCRVGGEVECSIIQGHTNKYHEGFLGHSYLGEWVNVGAGAHTSDLRLDYGPITMLLGDESIATGRTKIGSMLGDHTRVGIGSLLNTGTTAGVFCNLLPSGELLPRGIPSFSRVSHGEVVPERNIELQLAVAETAMSRRGEVLTAATRAMYLHLRDSGRAKGGVTPPLPTGRSEMKDFADLWVALDTTTKTNLKVAAMKDYFLRAAPASAAWAVWFLSGRKPRSAVTTRQMRTWVTEHLNLSEWLFQECYDAVGDLAETFTLLLPASEDPVQRTLADWVENHLLPLRGMKEEAQKAAVLKAWSELDTRQGFIWNKLITGGFRVGVSQSLVTRALAQASGIPAEAVAHRLMGEWSPTPGFYSRLLSKDTGDADASQPYPFCLAHPLEAEVETLGDVSEWFAEWKWDGIRSQLIRRESQVFLWSRGEELVTDRYPELKALGEALPDGTVLDAEILPWFDGKVQPFAQLQKRIGRKTVGKKLLEEIPVILMAYDLLELAGVDLRERPLIERRIALADLVAKLEAKPANSLFSLPGKASAVPASPTAALPLPLKLSPEVAAGSWEDLSRERDQSRFRSVEGLMLKRRTSTYKVGRVRGDWWKWKVQPFTFDGVLIYAQRGSGKRASLYSDYTFGVWDGDKLVPVAKAYSGLTDAEMKQVDAFVRKNTLETFGPVRTVKAELVMELGFEGIALSTRHKSGIAVRFPRILRWRTDKTMQDADRLENIKAMLPKAGVPEAENGEGENLAGKEAESE